MTAAVNRPDGHDAAPLCKNRANPITQPPRDIHFAFNGIAPLSRQDFSKGPNRGCESSHTSSRLEDLAKQAAARIRNGVVGRTGRNIPTKPKATRASPRHR